MDAPGDSVGKHPKKDACALHDNPMTWPDSSAVEKRVNKISPLKFSV